MSRELWIEDPCEHDEVREHGIGLNHRLTGVIDCPGGLRYRIDFDAIWRRFYETADRRFKEGLTYNELWFVVYGEKKEEE